jgi:hypothetical protein
MCALSGWMPNTLGLGAFGLIASDPRAVTMAGPVAKSVTLPPSTPTLAVIHGTGRARWARTLLEDWELCLLRIRTPLEVRRDPAEMKRIASRGVIS